MPIVVRSGLRNRRRDFTRPIVAVLLALVMSLRGASALLACPMTGTPSSDVTSAAGVMHHQHDTELPVQTRAPDAPPPNAQECVLMAMCGPALLPHEHVATLTVIEQDGDPVWISATADSIDRTPDPPPPRT